MAAAKLVPVLGQITPLTVQGLPGATAYCEQWSQTMLFGTAIVPAGPAASIAGPKFDIGQNVSGAVHGPLTPPAAVGAVPERQNTWAALQNLN